MKIESWHLVLSIATPKRFTTGDKQNTIEKVRIVNNLIRRYKIKRENRRGRDKVIDRRNKRIILEKKIFMLHIYVKRDLLFVKCNPCGTHYKSEDRISNKLVLFTLIVRYCISTC